MRSVRTIVYRYLTDADFFNINKHRGTETAGGGQSYIDFPTSDIDVAKWKQFFDGVTGCVETIKTAGPAWEFPIHSIGLPTSNDRTLKIYQRRAASVSITAQKIHSNQSNRVLAWHPTYGFPIPKNPFNRQQLPAGLAVYLLRTNEDEIWAGWFIRGDKSNMPSGNPLVLAYLSEMFASSRVEGDAGMLFCDAGLINLDEKKPKSALIPGAGLTKGAKAKSTQPYLTTIKAKVKPAKKAKKPAKTFKQKTRTEAEVIDSLFSEDSDYADSKDTEIIKTVTIIQKRNRQSVADLKALYEHKCQVTGDKYLFKKKNGTNYTEAHHLIPLGDGGADNPLNMVIVSPLVHRMLHYADVGEIDLSTIKAKPDGSAFLDIKINGEKYTISWKRRHFEMIMKHI